MQSKRIFSISMVKNEEDIIESFVRYNINILDGMIILDNGSTDNTATILRLLEKEGLPIYILDDEDREYNQAFKMNQLLLKAINEFKANIIVPLDADEFIISSSEVNPRKLLEKIEFPVFSLVKWKTYVPTFDRNEKFIPAKITFARDDSLEEYYKVIIPKELVENYGAKLTKGNHDLIYDQKYEDSVKRILNPNLRIAHFPIRSKDQVLSRISVGWILSLCDINRKKHESGHKQKMFNELKKTGKIEDEDVINFAKAFALVKEETEIKIYEDPINLSFCENIEVKYTDGKINPLANLLESCEWISLAYLNLKKEVLAERMEFKAQIENLEKDKMDTEKILKNKILEYQNSTSWMITSPLRKLGKILKSLKS
ncbi:glycosyltransferase family 2 protein [Methanobacterium sp.]|uniref:glycosyltransferase family 2 protein n=1 Tax=Methanobacterium sp. TaxID=2164 RepID=UPI003C7692D1